MGAQTDYIRENLTSLQSQINALQVQLGALLSAAEGSVTSANFLDNTGREPERTKTQAAYQALSEAVAAFNAVTIIIPSEADFMDGYDAAV